MAIATPTIIGNLLATDSIPKRVSKHMRVCYGVDGMGKMHPTGWETPNTEPKHSGSETITKNVKLGDNKHICSPVYPTLGR